MLVKSRQLGAVSSQTQIFALNKTREVTAQSVLSLVDGAAQSAQAIQASNPAHLGQKIDVKA
ncbi:hypothetical protein GKE73_15605 [Paludibacterium sp. dN 18-1]|uniref:Motility protein n=1 Tax=Paludibacterium denitrificans TaxID=2675226 RepID=A0A844GHC6_9NEIS|nr:hypothetical protein [Paludibacterium denitrificans]